MTGYSVEILTGPTKANLQDILTAHRAAIPERWQYADVEHYYAEQLHNRNAIHILLRRQNEPIGYLLAIPLSEAAQEEELRLADPELVADPERLYVETMEILSECAKSLVGGKLCLMMLDAVGDEAIRRGLCKFAYHARISTGLSRALRKVYGDMLTKFRRIENWPFYNGEEPTEYIEMTYRGRQSRKHGLHE